MSEDLDQSPAPIATESVPAPSGDGVLSVRDAANALSGYREKRDSTSPVEEAAPPTDTEDAAPVEEQTAPEEHASEMPADAQAEPEGEALPPIEAPRSWSKEEKERFASLPRETQDYLTRRENERDTALRRGQNEAATLRQTLDTEKKAMEQMRQQYEQALPILLQQVQQSQMGEFADIRTQQDVYNLARSDPARFAMWQAKQMEAQNLNAQIQANYERQNQEYVQKWNDFAKAEDQLFAQRAPEMADPQKAQMMADKAVSLLRDTGFSDDDLGQLWSGKASVSLRDHRMQDIIRKAALYDAAKISAPAKRAALPPSKTLRPGSPQERASDAQSEIDSLNKNLSKSGHWKDGAALLIARRSGRK